MKLKSVSLILEWALSKLATELFLAPATGGNVAKLFVKEGEEVKQQQLLLEVWNDNLKAKLTLHKAQIKANKATASQVCELAAGAKREARRLVRLKKTDHIISEEQVDKATTSAQAQKYSCQAAHTSTEVEQANLLLTKVAIEQTQVRAPFDGTVAEINAELGEMSHPHLPAYLPCLPLIYWTLVV